MDKKLLEKQLGGKDMHPASQDAENHTFLPLS